MFKLITNKLLSFLGIKQTEKKVTPKKSSGVPSSTSKNYPPRPPRKFSGALERPEESSAKKRRRPRKKAPAPAVTTEAAKPRSGNCPYQVRPALPKPEQLIVPPEVEGKVRFCDLNIHEDIKFAIQEMKFEYCTEIQTMALPIVLSGQDIAAKAQTGTGKTAAFLLAIFNNLLNNPKNDRRPGQCRALVMAPTRELAIQIYKDAESIARFTNLHNVVVFGGMDHEKQRAQLAQPIDILIGTPGRIIDFSRSGNLLLNQVETLVIDEADRMLDMGFIPDVKRIIAQTPPKTSRQTLLFSATLDEHVMSLAESFLNNHQLVESEPEKLVGDLIEQLFYVVSGSEKLAFLVNLLQKNDFERVLIFGNRKDRNSKLQYDLAQYGIECELLSGDISQEKRLKILENFRAGSSRVVIATDVAARGIHVDNVSLVVNFDLPEHPEDYVHRIGRTGRAGHEGKSISLLCEYGAYTLPAIEDLLKVKFHGIMPEESMLILPEKNPIKGFKRSESRPPFHGGDSRRPRPRQ